jgi:nucleoside phosphorylase
MNYQPPSGLMGRTRVAIISVIDEEFDAVRDAFGTTTNIEGAPYFVPAILAEPNYDIVALQAADRSNVPFSGDVSDVIEDFRPQVLVLVGVAGGLCNKTENKKKKKKTKKNSYEGRDGIGLGHVLIADYVAYVEFMKITEDGTFFRQYALDHPSLAFKKNLAMPISKTFRLRSEISISPPSKCDLKIHIGMLVSGEKVFGGVDNKVQKDLLGPFDNALAVDMESVGLARKVCERRESFWYHPRYAIIRGISDLVGPKGNNAKRRKWKAFAAHSAAVVAKEFVRRLS